MSTMSLADGASMQGSARKEPVRITDLRAQSRKWRGWSKEAI